MQILFDYNNGERGYNERFSQRSTWNAHLVGGYPYNSNMISGTYALSWRPSPATDEALRTTRGWLEQCYRTSSRSCQSVPLIFTRTANLCLTLSCRLDSFALPNQMQLLSRSWRPRAWGMSQGAVSSTAGVGVKECKPYHPTFVMERVRYGYQTYHERSVRQPCLLGNAIFAILGSIACVELNFCFTLNKSIIHKKSQLPQ